MLRHLNRFRNGRVATAQEALQMAGLCRAPHLVSLGLVHLPPFQRWFNAHRYSPNDGKNSTAFRWRRSALHRSEITARYPS